MNDFYSQIILAARNRDAKDTGWMQLLVFVVLAAVYGLGSIIKAKAKRAEQQDEEQLTRKPARKPPDAGKSLQKPPSSHPVAPRRRYPQAVQPPHRKVVRPQPAVQKLTTEKERKIQFETIEPQLQPQFQELPQFTSETIEKLGGKRISIPAETLQPKYLSDILLDYADAEKLRRAILHYEILGKPLSLRGPSGHIIGL